MANLLSKDEVDVLMKAMAGGDVPISERPPAPKRKVAPPADIKEYDFRHPVMFLMDQLRTLQMIHESFARNLANSLATYLRTTVHVRCVSASQFSYSEFVRALPEPCALANIRFRPSEGRVLMAISPAIGSAFIDRVMGGEGLMDEVSQQFTEIEQFVIDDVVAIALKELEPAWNRLMKVSFTAESIDYTTQFVHVASQDETVVAVVLEVTFGPASGLITFCYPFRALTPVIERLNARQWVAEDQKTQGESRHSMQAALNDITVKLSARLGSASLTMQDVVGLKAGDVFVLKKELDQPAELDVAGRTKFKGYLGTHHGKLALLVSERVN